jgi:hypothetical protein
MSKTPERSETVNRRTFLLALGSGAAATAGAAATLGGAAPAAQAEAPDQGGYRETDHVRQAYETARF